MKTRCEYKKLVPLNELKPHPKNRNRHGDDQVSRLAHIFEYQGIRHPIIVSNLSGFIVAGHGRLAAATKLGFKEFPVDYQDFGSEEEEYAFLVSDNAVALWAELDLSGINADIGDLGPDFDIDLLGIKNFTIEVADKEGLTDEDEIPEFVEPKTKIGDIYKLGNHRLMCGDSVAMTDIDALLDGAKIDMAYCDPPYGADIVSSKLSAGGDKPFGNIGNMEGKAVKAGVYAPILGDETTDTAKDSFVLCSTLSKTQVFWGAQYYAETLPPCSGWIVWDKQTDGSLGDGELAYTNQKRAIRIFQHKWSGMIKASERGERRVHPTQKPIALAVWCFENYGEPKNVLDLFGGSGSTLIACEKTNRKCFMMELSPNYCDVIIARWEKFTGKTAELMPSGSEGV